MKKIKLGTQILIGIALGLLIGFISPKAASFISPLGDIFLNLLKMLIVPLVFFSITNGVIMMQDAKQLRSVGGRIILFYVISSLVAAVFGTTAALITKPGQNATDFANILTSEAGSAVEFNFIKNVVSWFPTNIIDAMANANMLQIIIFCIFLGVALLALGDKVSTIKKLIAQGNDVMLKITEYVIAFSPFGICALMAKLVSTISGAMMKEVIVFVLTIDIVILIYGLIWYPLMLKLVAKLNVPRFFKKITEPMIVAFTTTSSAATLPVSISVARDKLGCPEKVYGFTLPLGNTANMNGAAIQFSVIAVFASYLFGLPITASSLFQFIFLALILSIGAAGVKGAGIVMSTIIISTLIGEEGLVLIPILAAIWPTIDPFATLANNVGDLVGTTVVSKQMGLLDEEVFNSDN